MRLPKTRTRKRLDALEERVQSLALELDDVADDVRDIEREAPTEQDIDRLEDRVDELENKLDGEE